MRKSGGLRLQEACVETAKSFEYRIACNRWPVSMSYRREEILIMTDLGEQA